MKKKNQITISKEELNELLLCSFRYYLGRGTIQASVFPKDFLIKYWDEIPSAYKQQMKRDIMELIDNKDYTDYEKRQWFEILNKD